MRPKKKVTKETVSERIINLKGLEMTQYDFDSIIRIIRQSKTPYDAEILLRDHFKLIDSQAKFILELDLITLNMFCKEGVEEEIKKFKALKNLLDE